MYCWTVKLTRSRLKPTVAAVYTKGNATSRRIICLPPSCRPPHVLLCVPHGGILVVVLVTKPCGTLCRPSAQACTRPKSHTRIYNIHANWRHEVDGWAASQACIIASMAVCVLHYCCAAPATSWWWFACQCLYQSCGALHLGAAPPPTHRHFPPHKILP